MKIKTSELSGKALDWAVAKVLGEKEFFEPFYPDPYDGYGSGPVYTTRDYSTDWAQGGPIIDKHDIDVLRDDERGLSGARLGMMSKHPTRNVMSWFPMRGPTKLIAAMRCFVASKLGNEVDVPEEML